MIADRAEAVLATWERLNRQLGTARSLAPVHEMTADDIRELLPVVTSILRTARATEEWMMDWRASLWSQARELNPPITHPELGRLGGVSEQQVMKTLRGRGSVTTV